MVKYAHTVRFGTKKKDNRRIFYQALRDQQKLSILDRFSHTLHSFQYSHCIELKSQ